MRWPPVSSWLLTKSGSSIRPGQIGAHPRWAGTCYVTLLSPTVSLQLKARLVRPATVNGLAIYRPGVGEAYNKLRLKDAQAAHKDKCDIQAADLRGHNRAQRRKPNRPWTRSFLGCTGRRMMQHAQLYNAKLFIFKTWQNRQSLLATRRVCPFCKSAASRCQTSGHPAAT